MINYLNEYTIILLIIIIFIIISQYDLKYILLILITLYILYIYSQNIIANDIITYKNTKYNEKISILFDRLSKYKHLNIIEYKYGLNYWYRFINNIKKSNINVQGNFYDITENYLDTSIKHFKSLTIKSSNKTLFNTINSLYDEGLLLLKNLSIDLNNKWNNNPNTLTKQVIFNQPKPHNISFI